MLNFGRKSKVQKKNVKIRGRKDNKKERSCKIKCVWAYLLALPLRGPGEARHEGLRLRRAAPVARLASGAAGSPDIRSVARSGKLDRARSRLYRNYYGKLCHHFGSISPCSAVSDLALRCVLRAERPRGEEGNDADLEAL